MNLGQDKATPIIMISCFLPASFLKDFTFYSVFVYLMHSSLSEKTAHRESFFTVIVAIDIMNHLPACLGSASAYCWGLSSSGVAGVYPKHPQLAFPTF